MPQAHIRLARTPDVDKVLTFLRSKYRLLSEAEILKLLLSEKYEEEMKESMEKELQLTHQFTTNVLDLETYPNVQEAKAQVRVPRKHINLLSMAGAFKGAPDLSRNKKNIPINPCQTILINHSVPNESSLLIPQQLHQ